MVRLIAFTVVLVGFAFGYEEYTGHNIGVKRAIGGVLQMVPVGGYGVSTGVGTSTFGGGGGGISGAASNAGGLTGMAAGALGN